MRPSERMTEIKTKHKEEQKNYLRVLVCLITTLIASIFVVSYLHIDTWIGNAAVCCIMAAAIVILLYGERYDERYRARIKALMADLDAEYEKAGGQ